jgi:DNA-binding transcriptional MerR regulator
MPQVDRVDIPNRALFRPPEVCEIAKVQPYVLRSWEAEFPDLGVAKTEGGPRFYRRADVERVLQLKHLVYVEGLTLSGARRRLGEAKPEGEADSLALASVDELFGAEARDRILQVKRGLQELATILARSPAAGEATAAEGPVTTLVEGPETAPAEAPMTAAAPPSETPSEFELNVAPVRKTTRRKKS